MSLAREPLVQIAPYASVGFFRVPEPWCDRDRSASEVAFGLMERSRFAGLVVAA